MAILWGYPVELRFLSYFNSNSDVTLTGASFDDTDTIYGTTSLTYVLGGAPAQSVPGRLYYVSDSQAFFVPDHTLDPQTDVLDSASPDSSIYSFVGRAEGNNSANTLNAGTDPLIGSGNDWIYGDRGNDTIHGGAGGDTIDAGRDNDVVHGEAGDDYIEGGRGDDLILGGAGADTILGGYDDDTIHVAENDVADGGYNDDTFILTQDSTQAGNGHIALDGSFGNDTLNLNGQADRSTLSVSGNSGSVTMLDGTTVSWSNIENVVCFALGTSILTPHGPRRIETLQPGDLVVTRDAGVRPVLWVGRNTVSGQGRFAPVEIAPGRMGNHAPLRVSPQHRMLVAHYRCTLMTGLPEALCLARHICDGTTIRRRPVRSVTYLHLALDGHHLVQANGAWAETLFVCDQSLRHLHPAVRAELLDHLPLRWSATAFSRALLTRSEAQAIYAA